MKLLLFLFALLFSLASTAPVPDDDYICKKEILLCMQPCTPLEKEREKTNDNMLTVCTSMCMNKYLAANAEYKSTGIAKCF